MKRLLFFLITICYTQLNAQDITGIWRGNFTNNGTVVNGYEVQLDNIGRMVKGVTYSYGGGQFKFYLKFSLVGMWNKDSKYILFQEDNLLDHTNTSISGVENFTCVLHYRKEGKKEILEGDYNSLNYTSKEIGSYAGNVHLEKVADSYFVKENFILKREEELLKKNAVSRQPIVQQTIVRPIQQSAKHLTTTVIPQKNKQKKVISSAEKISIPTLKKRDLTIENNQLFPANTIQTPNTKIVIPTEVPKVLLERTNQLFKTIQVTDKEIEVSFYDNGEVDGDSISVYLNGKQIAAHKRLTTVPITIKVEINENNPEQEVIMVAENLGTIPPNTALMIVKAGGKRYDVNISSNEQKNAAVRFKYQK